MPLAKHQRTSYTSNAQHVRKKQQRQHGALKAIPVQLSVCAMVTGRRSRHRRISSWDQLEARRGLDPALSKELLISPASSGDLSANRNKVCFCTDLTGTATICPRHHVVLVHWHSGCIGQFCPLQITCHDAIHNQQHSV